MKNNLLCYIHAEPETISESDGWLCCQQHYQNNQSFGRPGLLTHTLPQKHSRGSFHPANLGELQQLFRHLFIYVRPLSDEPSEPRRKHAARPA